jgi:hypothetical protein
MNVLASGVVQLSDKKFHSCCAIVHRAQLDVKGGYIA